MYKRKPIGDLIEARPDARSSLTKVTSIKGDCLGITRREHTASLWGEGVAETPWQKVFGYTLGLY